MDRAASLYREGRVLGVDQLAKNVTPDLAYILEIERYEAKLGGGDQPVRVSLRVTASTSKRRRCVAVATRSSSPFSIAAAALSWIRLENRKSFTSR